MAGDRSSLVGLRYGLLVVVEDSGLRQASHRLWSCKCDCGGISLATTGNLRAGRYRSCGCAKTTHGGSHLPEYDLYKQMLARCHDSKHPDFAFYGGRGIEVCEAWRKGFAAFLVDVGPRPFPEAHLDREDNGVGYQPGNVRWVTRAINMNNTRANTCLTLDGRKQSVGAWSEETGLSRSVIRARLHLGWSVERTLTQPARKSLTGEANEW